MGAPHLNLGTRHAAATTASLRVRARLFAIIPSGVFFFFVVWLSPICAHKYAQAYNLITDINLGTNTHTKAMRIPHPPPRKSALCGGARWWDEKRRRGGRRREQFFNFTQDEHDLFAADMRCWLPRQPTNFATTERDGGDEKKHHHQQQPERCSITLENFQFLGGYVMQ